MNTKKKLYRARLRREAELAAEDKAPPLAFKWVRHEQKMNRMLEGIDPNRFEALASGVT